MANNVKRTLLNDEQFLMGPTLKPAKTVRLQFHLTMIKIHLNYT